MKGKELMIGDWVQHPVYMGNLVACRVVGISTEITVEFETGARKYEALEFAQPIPLTNKILELNGFDVSDGEVMRYNFEENGQSFHFSLRQMYDKENKPKGYSFYAFNVLTIIDFVHELQHALKLCGIDKNIEL